MKTSQNCGTSNGLPLSLGPTRRKRLRSHYRQELATCVFGLITRAIQGLGATLRIPGLLVVTMLVSTKLTSLGATQTNLVTVGPTNSVIVTNIVPTLYYWTVPSDVVLESSGRAIFTINATPPPTAPVAVGWFLGAGTAIPGTDFLPPFGGIVPFGPGQASADIPITLIGDFQAVGGDKTLILGMTPPTGGISSSNPFVGVTIVDDVVISNPPPVLTLTKSALADNVKLGETVEFTIVLSNVGPGTATNVVLVDALPEGLDYLGTLSGPAPASATSRVVSWQFPIVPPGSQTLVLQTMAQMPGSWNNVAQASYATNTPISALATVVVNPILLITNPPPLLSITKSAMPEAINVGDTVVYTITVNNAGPGTATNVVVSDTLPDGVDYIGTVSGPAPDSATARTVSWQLPVVPPGSQVLSIQARAQLQGTWQNIAEASYSTNPPISAFASVVVNPMIVTTNLLPILALSKSVDQASAKAGDSVNFIIVVANSGAGTATNVTLVDEFPAGLGYNGMSSGPGPTTISSNSLVWQIPLLPPGSQTFTLQSQAQLPGPWTNTAQLQYGSNPPILASASVLVISNIIVPTNLVDLRLSKIASVPEAAVGDPIQFSIFVTNNGIWPATNVIVKDSLPPGFQLVSAFDGGNPAAFDPVSGQWVLGFVPPGAVRLLTLNTVGAAIGPWTNEADIIYPPNLDRNAVPHGAAFVNLMAPAKADLVIMKVVDSTPVGVEQLLTFTIRVGNTGPDDSKDIVVKDTFPAGMIYKDSTVPDGTTFDPKKLEWTIPALAKDKFVDLEIKTTSKTPLIATNVVEITATGVADPFKDNNRAQAVGQWILYSACGYVRFCNAFGGDPHTNALVELQQAGKVLQTTRSDSQGAFCFTNLQAGSYQLIAKPNDPKSGIKDSQLDTIEFGDGKAGGVLQLVSPWPVVRGRITYGTNGPPVAGLEVKLVGKDGTGKAVAATATTDKNGMYLFPDIDDGTYTVTPTPTKIAGFNPTRTQIKSSGCMNEANFIYGSDRRIVGHIFTCDGVNSPVPYAAVTLSSKDYPNIRTVVTGTDGAYSFRGLADGDYTIDATHPAYTIASVDVKVAGNNITKNLQASPKAGIIFARVIDGKGAPVAGIDVAIFPPGAARATATLTTDTNGVVTFEKVAAGNWAVQAQSPDVNKIGFTPNIDFVSVGVPKVCRNTCVFVINVNAVEVVALEVVQVIQDWPNSMPLVEGKQTLLRVFLKPAGSNTVPVTVKGLKLKVEPAGGAATTIAAGEVVARADYAPIRNVKTTSLPIDVTKFAKGKVKFTLLWPNGILTTSPAATAAGAVADNAVSVTFNPAPPLNIKWLLLNWKFKTAEGKAAPAAVPVHRKRLVAALPITAVTGGEAPITWRPTEDPTAAAINDNTIALYDLVGDRRRRDEPAKSRVIYYTIVPGDIVRDNGLLGGDIVLIRENIGNGFYKNRPAHEVGHNLGRQHAVHSAYGITVDPNGSQKHGACDETADITAPDFPMDFLNGQPLQPTLGPMRLGDYRFGFGWDSSDGTYVSPFKTEDLMSYCTAGTDWSWPGLYTYPNLFNALVNRFGKGGAPGPNSVDPGTASIMIGGTINVGDDSTVLDPIWTTLGSADPILPVPGDYTLRLFTTGGIEILAAPFQPDAFIEADPVPIARTNASFRFVLPQTMPISGIEIDHGATVLLRRNLSAHAPELHITSPTTGTVVDGDELTLQWNSSDLDGDALRYTVDLSSDGGATWSTAGYNLDATTLTFSTASIHGSTNSMLRVTASDGMRISSDQVTFVIPDHPPTVVILTPDVGATLAGDQPAYLSAGVSDAEDGVLDGASVVWTSDRDGQLGTGALLSVSPADLSEGQHLITVTATDSAGHAVTAAETISIAHSDAPRVMAQIVDDDIEISWPAVYDVWQLQECLDIDIPNWFTVSVDPETVGDQVVVRVPATDDPIYFRLVAP